MRALGFLSSVFLATGCALAPGMRMDEAGVKARASDGAPIATITPALLTKQAEELRQARRAAEQDPLETELAQYQYQVAPYDLLDIIVWGHPELTASKAELLPTGSLQTGAELSGHMVAADGTLFYPYVGVVPVAGKTLPEIRTLLTERLARYVRQPQLDARIAAFRGRKVQVTGEVMAPGPVPLIDVPLRVQDAIAYCKGLNPEADPRQLSLTRDGQVHTLDLQSLYEAGDTSQNWLLQDGDLVHVPDRSHNAVFILGEVRKPSLRLMVKGRMTLAEALGGAEGLDPITSNPGKIYVIRGDFEKPSIYKLDASSPDALLLAVQFQLQPRDVVYVSSSELTRWNRVVGQILPSIQALWQSFDLTQRVIK